MAVRTPTPGPLDNTITYAWSGLLNGDTGAPVYAPDFADRSFQLTGTFGVGGSVNIEGSLDGTNYAVLRDPQGVALTLTAASLKAVLESVLWIRPNVTAGDGTTSLIVTLYGRRSRT